nr:copia protein [Tanacetum cinerariifolium]
MSRDVITVSSTMRIPLLYQGEYSQWRKRFMNHLEEQTDGKAMINSIQNDDQPLAVIVQVNETAKDLWDALERQMRSSEYGEQDRKAAILYEYETFKAIEGEQLLDTYLHDVNDALGYKKKPVVVTSDPLALVAEKMKSDDKKEDKKADEKKRDMSKVKCYNCKKEGHFTKDCKQAKVKDYNSYKTKMLLAKKDSDEQVLLAEDQAWMEFSSDSDQEINANMVFMAQIEKVLLESNKSSSSAKETIAENNLFIFDDESVRISPDSKMPFRKKPRDSMNVRSKSNSNKSLPRTVHRWLPKMQPLAKPVAKWIPRICLWIINLGCSKHMTGNRALLTNFVEKFLGTVHFGNNDFAMIAGYGDVVIESMTINKVYYRYVLVVIDDYSRYTWVFFLHSKDEASEVIISFIKKTQVNLQLQVQRVRIDNGTEFKNKTLAKFFDEESSSSSLNDDVQQSPEEVGVPLSNTQSISNNMIPNVDEASTSHNVFNERLEDVYFDAIGYSQQEGIVYDETFTPVARIKDLRLFLAYAAHKDFTVFQMDVKTVFLNGILKEEVYVGQPLGFVSKQYPDHVYALDKPLYGLKQAHQAWYDVLSQFLIDSGSKKVQ